MKQMPDEVWVEQCEDGTPGRAFIMPGEWNNTNRLRTKYVRYVGPTYSRRDIGDLMVELFGNGTISSKVLDAFKEHFEKQP